MINEVPKRNRYNRTVWVGQLATSCFDRFDIHGQA